jgi:hypothetical protein
VLQLRHVLLGCGLFRKRPGQHEFGLEDRSGRFNTAVERSGHPAQRWVPNVALEYL